MRATIPRHGDALQRTVNGLLVWRKADNWTAFTDGSQSWVNGPLGLQQRSNDQRFWWEANPDGLAIVPTADAWRAMPHGGAQPGLIGVGCRVPATWSAPSASPTPWTRPARSSATRAPNCWTPPTTRCPPPSCVLAASSVAARRPATVDVAPHGSALLRIHWEQVPVGNETDLLDGQRHRRHAARRIRARSSSPRRSAHVAVATWTSAPSCQTRPEQRYAGVGVGDVEQLHLQPPVAVEAGALQAEGGVQQRRLRGIGRPAGRGRRRWPRPARCRTRGSGHASAGPRRRAGGSRSAACRGRRRSGTGSRRRTGARRSSERAKS